ncbi:hypothetical protein POM88_009218 [Heracleum sosnowskyi]|uniref:Reverse transcriptase domain-containing protein n=1 Tax=Heracleum sosnowskyi TaxID=360622 RepID=A0AAD8JBB4_9APIA|nr:hypothetical protein POM88_009218 [Heracleum sosnowskyi]
MRFNVEVPRVRGATEEAQKNFLIAGLREGSKSWKTLQAREPETLAEFYEQAETHKRVEKSMRDLRSSGRRMEKRGRSSSPEERRKTFKRSPSPKKFNKAKENVSKETGRPYTTKWQNHTPLVASIDHIYATYAGKGVFKKATPLTEYSKRDTSKYCAYHESTGHHTADCRQLKDEIESLIRQGKLTEWVVKEVRKHKSEYRQVPPPPPIAKDGDTERTDRADNIHVIIGGPHVGGDSKKAMERYAREAKDRPLTNVHRLEQRPPYLFTNERDEIMFSEEDAKWVHHPHADALVARIKIGSTNVYRVLVDNGSAVNILTYDTYKRLGFLDRELVSSGNQLYGFTGASVGIRGTIQLPVSLGDNPHVATQIVTFTVVDQPCAYNAIIGRPILKEMKVVTSVYHLTMKFPTPTGVGQVKGCQYDSRVCYNQAMKGTEKLDVLREVADLREREPVEDGEDKKRKRVDTLMMDVCNMISIEELPEDYFENLGIEVEPRPGALMMEPSQPIMTFQEGIVEEASDDEESPEQVASRLNKGKWVKKETSILINLPTGVSREVTIITEGNIQQEAPELSINNGDHLSITEVGEPSMDKNFDVDLDPRMPPLPDGAGTFEDIIPILVDPNDSAKVLRIGANLGPEMRDNLVSFLKENLDVFAWSHADMIGIDPEVMCHRLNLDPSKKGTRQKRRPVSGERAEALREEVDRLMEVGLIKESFYPTWLANPVLVKNPNGKWRTCVDFTDLNKACPKDSFPLPRIDQLVDTTAGHTLLSFMDAYSGYNQIPMYGPDQEHTSFITGRGLYCYIGMPFGLVNAGATYQRLVNKMFKDHIGKTMEVYVDDMLVKSKEAKDHIQHLAEMFTILRIYRMKLNPQKCVFGVESGKFLGFIVNHRGIEANPAKIKALMEMRSPRRVRDVQSLTGRIAALNRFVSKSSDKCQEFFKAIKKVGRNFQWTEECEETFQNIKRHLSTPPLLSNPQQGEVLVLYLAVSEYAVSAVLIREEGGVQLPVYYVSKRLVGAETRYLNMEKLVYALILASRKLRPYFQAHKVEVRIAYPLRQVLHKPETSGRMLKWVVELGQFDVEYKPRVAVKGQALADFMLEFSSQIEEDSRALQIFSEIPAEESQNSAP